MFFFILYTNAIIFSVFLFVIKLHVNTFVDGFICKCARANVGKIMDIYKIIMGNIEILRKLSIYYDIYIE